MILTANGRQLTPIDRGKKFKCLSPDFFDFIRNSILKSSFFSFLQTLLTPDRKVSLDSFEKMYFYSYKNN